MVTAERCGALRLRRWVADGDDHLADLPFRGEAASRSRATSSGWTARSTCAGGWRSAALGGQPAPRRGASRTCAWSTSTAPDRDHLELALVRGTDGRRIELPVERVHRPDVTVRSRDPYSYDWAGFRTVVDSRLPATTAKGGARRPGGWRRPSPQGR